MLRLAYLPIAGAALALLGVGVQYLAGLPARTALSSERCASEFGGGIAPRVPAEKITPLCYRQYSVGYSARILTSSRSAERLTGADVEKWWSLHREDDFHTESALSGRPRPELSDYLHSGYNRGRMTPSADMPDAASQDESLSLANVVLQDRENNRPSKPTSNRRYAGARADGTIYVVTGPIISSNPARLLGRVAVPVALYKPYMCQDRARPPMSPTTCRHATGGLYR